MRVNVTGPASGRTGSLKKVAPVAALKGGHRRLRRRAFQTFLGRFRDERRPERRRPLALGGSLAFGEIEGDGGVGQVGRRGEQPLAPRLGDRTQLGHGEVLVHAHVSFDGQARG